MTTFFHVSLVLGFQNYARNSYPSIAFWAMYFQKCIANPAHLAGLFCPVLFCPQKAIAVGIKFLAHFCYPLIKKTWKIFSKVGMVFCYYNCSDLLWKKIVLVIDKFFLKFEAEGRELSISLRSLEQFIQTVKGQNNFW